LAGNHPAKPTPDFFLVLDSGGSCIGLWDALWRPPVASRESIEAIGETIQKMHGNFLDLWTDLPRIVIPSR
jgi:hypothetical protein